MKDMSLWGQEGMHKMLWVPVIWAMAFGLILVHAQRPVHSGMLGVAFVFVAMTGSSAAHVLRAQAKRIKQLEDQMALLQQDRPR